MLFDYGILTRIGLKTEGVPEGPGTPQYSSPGQLNGREASPYDDIFSLGRIINDFAHRMSVEDAAPFHAIENEIKARKIINVPELRIRMQQILGTKNRPWDLSSGRQAD